MQKLIMTRAENWQFRKAQSLNDQFRLAALGVCATNPEIRCCYLLDGRRDEKEDLKLFIALLLDNEKDALDRAAAGFQEMLKSYPVIAEKTAIMSAESLEHQYAGAEFYVRTQTGNQ